MFDILQTRIAMLYTFLKRSKRRASTMGPAAMVVTLIVVALTVVVGSIAYVRSYNTLSGLRDSTFSATANSTIAGVDTDFWNGVSLIRLLLILIPAGAVVGAVIYYLVGGGSPL